MNKNMKKVFTIALLLCSAFLTQAETYTLKACIDTAIHRNLQVKQKDMAREQQAILYNQARMNLLPSVSAGVGQSWVFGRSTGADNITRSQNSSNTNFNIAANLTLFDGLKMKFAIDETKANMLASEADIRALEQTIELNINSIYLQVLQQKEYISIALQKIEDTEQKIEKTESQISEGRLAEGEIYALRAQLASEQLELTQAQNEHQLLLLDLAQAMDLDYSADFDIAPEDTTLISEQLIPSNEEVYTEALKNRAEIKVAEQQLKAAETALKSAKANYSPTLSAGVNFGTGYYHIAGTDNTSFGKQMGDNLSTNVGLNLTIPIFDRLQTHNNIRSKKISIEQQNLQIEQIKQELKKQIDQAWLSAKAAQAQLYSAMQSAKTTQEALRYEENKYENGKSSYYAYSEAKNKHSQSLNSLAGAKYNFLFKIKVLEYYMAQ